MATTISDDAIKAQWKKQNDAHQKAQESVALIARHLGLTVDANGNIKADETTQTIQGNPALDVELLKTEIAGIIQTYFEKSQGDKLSDEELLKRITEPWDEWLSGYIRRIHKVHCDFVSKVEKAIKERVSQTPVVTEDKPSTSPPKPLADGIHSIRKFFGKVFGWFSGYMAKFAEDIALTWWKFSAYLIASIAISFALYFWYQYRQLLPYAQEYAIVRTALAKDPEAARTILEIHSAMEADDTDAILRIIEKSSQISGK